MLAESYNLDSSLIYVNSLSGSNKSYLQLVEHVVVFLHCDVNSKLHKDAKRALFLFLYLEFWSS